MFSDHHGICWVNSYERKATDVDGYRTAKKQQHSNQIGEGKIEEPAKDVKDDPCNFKSAFNDSLKKIERKQWKDQKQHCSISQNPNLTEKMDAQQQ